MVLLYIIIHHNTSYMTTFFANIITFIHILYILFIVVIPFTNSNYLLFLHTIIVPFMVIHWLLNDNTCFLTLLEKYVRNSTDDCFTCKIIEPIYGFNNNYKHMSDIIYIITLFLWVISFTKLYKKFSNKEIQTFYDLAKI